MFSSSASETFVCTLGWILQLIVCHKYWISASLFPRISQLVERIFHSVLPYKFLNVLCWIKNLTTNYFLKEFLIVAVLHCLQDALIHRLNQRSHVWREKHAGNRPIAGFQLFRMSRTVSCPLATNFRQTNVLCTLVMFNSQDITSVQKAQQFLPLQKVFPLGCLDF